MDAIFLILRVAIINETPFCILVMVSIPDWSRFRRGPPPPSPQLSRRPLTPRERYIRSMEKEAINEASKKGYFLTPGKDAIISEFGKMRLMSLICTFLIIIL